MSKLMALRFDDSESAEEALKRMQAASTSDDVALYDALTISWPDGRRRPTTHRPLFLTVAGKSIETLQILVISLLHVLVTLGSAALFVAGHLLRSGISPDFVAEVRNQITSGTSILVLMTDAKSGEKLDTLFADLAPQEIESNSFVQEERS